MECEDSDAAAAQIVRCRPRILKIGDEDLFQDTALACLQKQDSCDWSVPQQGLILRIASNKLKESRRKQRNCQRALMGLSRIHVTVDESSPLHSLVTREDQTMARNELAKSKVLQERFDGDCARPMTVADRKRVSRALMCVRQKMVP